MNVDKLVVELKTHYRRLPGMRHGNPWMRIKISKNVKWLSCRMQFRYFDFMHIIPSSFYRILVPLIPNRLTENVTSELALK
jgi:hypothetical protein